MELENNLQEDAVPISYDLAHASTLHSCDNYNTVSQSRKTFVQCTGLIEILLVCFLFVWECVCVVLCGVF